MTNDSRRSPFNGFVVLIASVALGVCIGWAIGSTTQAGDTQALPARIHPAGVSRSATPSLPSTGGTCPHMTGSKAGSQVPHECSSTDSNACCPE